MKDKKRILVTGGAGFLGSHLCERLLRDGNKVVCLDNFLTSHKHNLIRFNDNPDFEILHHDIIESIHVEVDEIYNLACPASPIHYQKYPIQTLRTCIEGTINMLELASKRHIPLFQASTSEVYGDPKVHPQPEEYFGNVNIVGPRSCYDEGKRAAETACYEYQRQLGVKVRVARIFNSYGPRMAINDGRVVSNFIVEALQNKDITIYGDGTQTRSFCYYSDIIEGVVRLMRTSGRLEGAINLGNPNEFTVKELAETIINLTESKSKLAYFAPLLDDPLQRCPDIAKAKKKLNWTPKVELEEGLNKTISYFKSII